MRADQDRLRDILEALSRIRKYVDYDREAFLADELVQVWAVYHIEMAGEAARGVSEELRVQHPQVPWADLVAMRNVLVHQYFGIDFEEVWDTLAADLPALERMIRDILAQT